MAAPLPPATRTEFLSTFEVSPKMETSLVPVFWLVGKERTTEKEEPRAGEGEIEKTSMVFTHTRLHSGNDGARDLSAIIVNGHGLHGTVLHRDRHLGGLS